MSTNFAIGYERLLELFKDAQKQSPTGVSLKRKGSGNKQRIYLQFKIGSKARQPYACNCTFSLDGIASASKKAKLVAEKLSESTSEVEFMAWYDKEIKEVSDIKNDMLTFSEVVAKIENEFFEGYRLFKKPLEKETRIILAIELAGIMYMGNITNIYRKINQLTLKTLRILYLDGKKEVKLTKTLFQ